MLNKLKNQLKSRFNPTIAIATTTTLYTIRHKFGRPPEIEMVTKWCKWRPPELEFFYYEECGIWDTETLDKLLPK